MHVDPTDIIGLVIIALASGRIAYSLTKDEIFRPIREWIWLHSAPEDGMIVRRGDDGDLTLPARAMHRVNGPQANIGDTSHRYEFQPQRSLRKPQFFGQLFECFYCMTWWTSLLALIAWSVAPEFAVAAALPFAVWAVANSYAAKGL